MWALLDYDKKTVIACVPPDAPQDLITEEINGRIVIPMTLENSPAYIGGTYENDKFHPKKEINNG